MLHEDVIKLVFLFGGPRRLTSRIATTYLDAAGVLSRDCRYGADCRTAAARRATKPASRPHSEVLVIRVPRARMCRT